MNIISKQTLISCALLSLTACASLPDAETENTAPMAVSATPPVAVVAPPLAKTAQLAPATKKKSSRKARRSAAKKATTKQAKAKKSRVQTVVRKQLSVEKFAASLDTNDDKQDLWTRIREGYALKAPTEDNGQIRRAIERFVRAPSYFRDISNRASPFLYHIVEEIEQRGMPLEIALLPAIESAFEPGALSPKRAAGIWQFTPGTARNFGLQLDSWYDGRRDVVASTSAALDYLQKLHQEFNGDWFTALAAYNFGEGNIRKAIERNRSAGRPTDFWSLDLPAETRNYIPSLLAISTIIAKPHQYGISLRSIADSPQIEHIEIGSQIDLTVAARLAGLSPLDLKRLNPGYRRSITAPEGPFGIALPIDKADDFKRRLADLSAEQLVSSSVKAQVVAEVAADKDEDIKALPEDNNTVASNADAKNLLKVNTAKVLRQYRVSRGDTLASIAQRHGTTVEYLRSLNQALNTRGLKIGEVLQVPSKVTAASNETAKTPLKLASHFSN
ncbi:MAG: transglycosylase SLT domain-containing protein [Thiotrichaceae bacterium]|nr:transglycosylase SLT domain-containing protein [Thiotrichaceae bacterium]